MSRFADLRVWVLAALYAAALGLATLTSLQAAWARDEAAARGPAIVLAPLERAASSAPRTVDTRVGDLHLRRICAAGRCELLAGRRDGFELLASYPADRYVEVERGPRLHVHRLGETEAWRRARVERDPGRAPLHWLIAVFAGIVLFTVVAARRETLAQRVWLLQRARPATVDPDGTLRFADERFPRTAVPTAPLPPGPATALFAVDRHLRADSPYRGVEGERWAATAGRPAENLARAARRLGATGALLWTALLLTGGCVATVLALTG
jgi:hypothetical protein